MDISKKDLWMRESEKQKEQEVLSLLNNNELNNTEKAKKLGYKKQSIYLDGQKRKGWVNGEDLALDVRNLIKSLKELPLGFDFYYWGEENYKMKLRETPDEFFKVYPKACKTCLDSGWIRSKNKSCTCSPY